MGFSPILRFRSPGLCAGASVFLGKEMHYFVYLDEFGHIGPYVSRTHPKYNTSPLFGLAGLIFPASSIRKFSAFFFQLKIASVHMN